jgi:hypothetical protein
VVPADSFPGDRCDCEEQNGKKAAWREMCPIIRHLGSGIRRNGDKPAYASLKSPVGSCVAITLPTSIEDDPEKFNAFASRVVLKKSAGVVRHPPALLLYEL